VNAEEFPSPAELLPHGPTMRFISRILAFEDEMLECEVIPGAHDMAFARDGAIPAAVGVEYMAQAIAAFVSLKTGRDHSKPGFVMAIRRMKVEVTRFALHKPLRIHVERRWGEVRAARFDAVVYDGDTVVLQGALSVFRPTDEEQG
jgi:predicted hotdog family 3-hydroxylacyl-ACP dehydratase